jgi:single-strand DNA-binding protein
MADVNKTIHTGRICHDLELKQTQSGVPVLSFTLAVNRPRVKDITDFLNIVCWRQNGEYLAKYAKKGSLISVVGTLQSRKFQDKDGKNHVAIEIVADEVSILANVQTNAGTAPTIPETDTPNFEEIAKDDDLPF